MALADDPTGAQASHNLQLTLQPPPPPAPQPVVVDRIAYLNEQRQFQEQQRQAAVQQYQQQQQALAQYAPLFNLREQTVGEVERLAALEQARQEWERRRTEINVTDFGYDPQDPMTWAEAERKARDRAMQVGGRIVYPGEDQTPLQGLAEGLGTAGRATGAVLGADIPGMQRVRDVVGQAARAAVIPDPQELAGLPGTSGVREGISGGVAEAFVPTEVWEAALELVPGIGSVPGLASAIRTGDSAAMRALRQAGQKLGKSEAVERTIRQLASERGALQIARQAEDVGGPTGDQAVIATLEEQRRNISRALRVLKGSEASRVSTGTVQDVFTIASRYERGSEQREALKQAVDLKTQHLPEVVRKFVAESIDMLPSKADRQLALKAQHTRQAGRSADAFESTTGTVEERAVASFKAMGGKQEQHFTPIGDRFTDAEIKDLMDFIPSALAGGKISRYFEPARATDALTLLLTGHRLPGVESLERRGVNLEPNEAALLGKVFGPEFEQAVRRLAPLRGKFHTFIDLINLPRAIVTAIDVSAAGRQGIMLAMRNPNEVRRAIVPMIRAMASAEGFERGSKAILNNKRFDEAIRLGLELTDLGGGAKAEEPFVSELVGKIPTWLGGGLIKGSERGYVMYLDTLRMLTYEKYADRIDRLATKNGWDVERLDMVKANVAKFLNAASGRGDLRWANEFTPTLNAVFFSPRFLVSRPQSIWAMVRPGADRTTRQIAFENIGSFVGTGVGMLYAAHLMGADVEIDPRSSDFGKIRVGNTRVDFWGGFQPIARYIAQAASVRQKELFTGDVKYAYPGSTVLRFFRSKLAPGGSLIYDYTAGQGKTYTGDDLFFSDPSALGFNKETRDKAWNDFVQRIVPLSIQDAIEGYNATGPGGAILGGSVSALGGGISSFEPSEKQKKQVAQGEFDKRFEQVVGEGYDTSFNFVPGDDRRQAMSAELFTPDDPIPEGWTIAQIKEKWTAWKVSRLVAQGVSESAAKGEADRLFKMFETIKAYERDKEAFARRTWEQNPELLKEALDAGRTDPAAYKTEILEKAGLR